MRGLRARYERAYERLALQKEKAIERFSLNGFACGLMPAGY
jgi:hypothetical protein